MRGGAAVETVATTPAHGSNLQLQSSGGPTSHGGGCGGASEERIESEMGDSPVELDVE